MKTREEFTNLAQAALLAFEYIGDRSAGSSLAWESLAHALGLDPEEATTTDMLSKLRKEIEG